jgi:hypothetical protein
MSHSSNNGVRRKQPLTAIKNNISITCVLLRRVPSTFSTISPIWTVRPKLELLNMPMILCPEKPCGAPLQSKDFDGKHEICHFFATYILEKICEQLPRYYYKLTAGDSEECLTTIFACDANTWTQQ